MSYVTKLSNIKKSSKYGKKRLLCTYVRSIFKSAKVRYIITTHYCVSPLIKESQILNVYTLPEISYLSMTVTYKNGDNSVAFSNTMRRCAAIERSTTLDCYKLNREDIYV